MNTEALSEWAERLCTFYNAYAKQFNGPQNILRKGPCMLIFAAGTFVRSSQYFQGWISANFRIFPGVLIVALDESNAIAGYLALQKKEPYILKEFIPATGLLLPLGLVLLIATICSHG